MNTAIGLYPEGGDGHAFYEYDARPVGGKTWGDWGADWLGCQAFCRRDLQCTFFQLLHDDPLCYIYYDAFNISRLNEQSGTMVVLAGCALGMCILQLESKVFGKHYMILHLHF